MKKPPYPALVKPDAVVLLPPEESEEREPRGLWPEPRRRPRWVSLAVIGVIFAAGLGLGLRLASRGAPQPIEVPEPVEAAIAPPQAPAAGDDVGAMDAASVPDPAPAAPQSEPQSEPESEPESGPLAGARLEPSVRAAVPPASRRAVPEPTPVDPSPRRSTEVATAQPTPQEATRDTAQLDLAPAPVGRTIVPSAEPLVSTAPAPLALEPPRRDPEVVREEARQVLRGGAERFAMAVEQARGGSSDALSGQVLASDAAARALLRFVQQSRPAASVTNLGPVTVRDGAAQADATLRLEWRGDFGVTRRGEVRVRLLAREGDGAWRLAGAQPLDGAPR